MTLLAGCLEFEPITAPPTDPYEQAAHLDVTVMVDDGPDLSRFRLAINETSGRDRDGGRPVTDDRIWIGGVAVVPERFATPSGILLRYSVEQDVPNTPIEIRLPSIGRIDASPPGLTLPAFPRIGADTIHAVDGADLRVTMDSVPRLRAADHSWYSVSLRRETRLVFNASAMSYRPPVFVIPGAMMTAVPGTSHAGELLAFVGQFSEWVAPDEDLWVTFSVSAHRTRPIRFISP